MDVIVDLQYGDCGKGKVAHYLAHKISYTHVLRYNGGCNAGHTIFHKGKKFVTHQIPAGVFFGIRSIIGSGCVVSVEQFFAELKMLKDSPHRPVKAIHVLSQIIYSMETLSPMNQMQMSENLTQFQDILGGCERILRTPIPVNYTR